MLLPWFYSKLPYDVEPEQALKHPEVNTRIEAAMKSLTMATETFLKAIVQSGDKLPWVMFFSFENYKASVNRYLLKMESLPII